MHPSFKPYLTLPLWIAFYLIVAYFIGDMTRGELPNWYATLSKPALNPPNFIFPIMWTTLYIMIAAAGWRLWRIKDASFGKTALILFAVQTILNWAWSYLFFDFHWLGVSFVELLLLVACVAALIKYLWAPDRITALLLTPYLIWICFAAYLNGMIWYLN